MSASVIRFSLLPLIFACGGEQTFSSSDPAPNTQNGKGAFSIEPTEIVWTELDWENSIGQSEVYVVGNVGDASMVISRINLSNAGALDSGNTFYVEEEEDDITLAAGATREFTIVATLNEFNMAEGELRIQTSDDDNLDVPIIFV